MATRLSVNVNKIATLRNARGGDNPNVLQTALDIVRFGGEGITVHPRPDERHIRKTDVYELHQKVKVEFNIEGYPSEEFVNMVLDVKPDQVTLVPDPPEVLTSNKGWDTVTHQNFLQEVIGRFKEIGIRTSIFVDPDPSGIESVKRTQTNRVELYTYNYAEQYPQDREKAIQPYIETAKAANQFGLGINAGHDLSLENLQYFQQNIPGLVEVSIGHALICDALYFGLEETIAKYLDCLK